MFRHWFNRLMYATGAFLVAPAAKFAALALAGFKAVGVTAGSWAASVQGPAVVAGSWFALAQSAAATANLPAAIAMAILGVILITVAFLFS